MGKALCFVTLLCLETIRQLLSSDLVKCYQMGYLSHSTLPLPCEVGGGGAQNSIITIYSANMDEIVVKQMPLAYTKRGSQKGGRRGEGIKK